MTVYSTTKNLYKNKLIFDQAIYMFKMKFQKV